MDSPEDKVARLSLEAMDLMRRQQHAAARRCLDEAIEVQRWLPTSGLPEGKMDMAVLLVQLAELYCRTGDQRAASDAAERALALLTQITTGHGTDDKRRAASVALGVAGVIDHPIFADQQHRALLFCALLASNLEDEDGLDREVVQLLVESGGRLARISLVGLPLPPSLSWNTVIEAAHWSVQHNAADIVEASNAIVAIAAVACALVVEGQLERAVGLLEVALAAGEGNPALRPGSLSALRTACDAVGRALADRPAERARVDAVRAAARRW